MRKSISKITASILAGAILILSTGCSDMSRQDRNTAIGAGVGGVAGAVLTNGSAAGTIGGAAVGGVIGNKTSK